MAQVTVNHAEVEAFKGDLVEAWYRTNSGPIKAIIREEAPIDTGLLRASQSADPPRRTQFGWLIRFRSEAAHTLPVHEGHGEIRPVKAKALRFVTKAGVVVFTQRVKPVAANPWFYRAFRRAGARNVRRIPQPD